MTLLNYILIALLAFFLIRRFLPAKGISHITTGELKSELKDKNKQFIDVRTPSEYKGRHIRSFTNIPLNTLSSKTATLNKEKDIIVICQSGMRSGQAAKILKKQGFTKVSNVKGGMNAWQD